MRSANLENLDIPTLSQYVAAIGANTLLNSVEIFEQMAPQYIGAIIRGFDQNDKNMITEEAHKLKGAAGTVGLKRIQQLAQRLQCGDEPQWELDNKSWFDDIRKHWEQDLKSLKVYLQQQC